MKKFNVSYPLLGFLIGLCSWTFFVAFAFSVLYFNTNGTESAGFMLMFFTLPSSIIFKYIHISGNELNQIIAMAIVGYIQWPFFGLIIGILEKKQRIKRMAK